jgi:hypothetical protein
MPYTVTRQPGVDDDLAALWNIAPDRNAFTAAADQIEQSLKFAPDSVGEDCGDHRTLTIAPLTVAYTFSADDCLVTILKFELSK